MRVRIIAITIGCVGGRLLLLLAGNGSFWTASLSGLVVAGVLNGMLNASLGHAAIDSVPPERPAIGSALNNTARYLR